MKHRASVTCMCLYSWKSCSAHVNVTRSCHEVSTFWKVYCKCEAWPVWLWRRSSTEYGVGVSVPDQWLSPAVGDRGSGLSGTMHRRRPWNVLGGGWNGGNTVGVDGDTTCEVKDDLGGRVKAGMVKSRLGFWLHNLKRGILAQQTSLSATNS
jgi:hypothetical protein